MWGILRLVFGRGRTMRGEAYIGMLVAVVVAVIVGVIMIPVLTGTIAEMSLEPGETEVVVAPETVVVPEAIVEPKSTDTGGEAQSNSGWLTTIQILAGLTALVLIAYKVYRGVFKSRSARESTEVFTGTKPKAKMTIFGIKIR